MGSLSPLRTHDGVGSLKLRSEGWGGTGFEEEHIKNTRDLKGRSKMVKGGMRIRGNGKAEILNQPVWEDLNFPEEATEIPNYS